MISAKFKLAAWFFFIIIILMVMMFMYVITVERANGIDDCEQRLTEIVLKNEQNLDIRLGNINLEKLVFYDQGVYCSFYDKEHNLINGATVSGIDTEVPFDEYALRTVTADQQEYYVYDAYVGILDTGIWVRGVIPVNDRSGKMHTISVLTYSLLPVLLAITLIGAGVLFKRVFHPIDQIIEAADSISEGSDLSARIDMKTTSTEMRELINTFNRMLDRLEKSFHGERQFASDASHELRTPITVIHAQCERSRRKDATPEDYQKSIDVIDEQSKKMSGLIDRLLGLTRLQQETTRYPMTDDDFSVFVESCCRDFAFTEGNGVRLVTQISKNITARYNSMLMSSVIFNLLENARKYGREDGKILVGLTRDEKGTHLTVADDGIGIAPEDLDKIWNRFWQADSSRGMDGGSGLGLALVKEITEYHGGTVSVSSVLHEGTVFTVTLP